MTVDDLMTLFQSARQGTRDWNGTEWVGVYGGDRAGVTAIVRALRDEIWTRIGCVEANDIINEILGSDAEEKVAEGIAERADEQRADAPATDPIRDAAPAVCVWTAQDEGPAHEIWKAECCDTMFERSGSPGWCLVCRAPIKFTEAK